MVFYSLREIVGLNLWGEVLVSVELLAGKQAVSMYRLLSPRLSQRLGGLCQGWDLGLHPPSHTVA